MLRPHPYERGIGRRLWDPGWRGVSQRHSYLAPRSTYNTSPTLDPDPTRRPLLPENSRRKRTLGREVRVSNNVLLAGNIHRRPLPLGQIPSAALPHETSSRVPTTGPRISRATRGSNGTALVTAPGDSLIGCRGLCSLEAEKGPRGRGIVYLEGCWTGITLSCAVIRGMFTVIIERRQG